jgi:hypothetical protein
MGSMTVTKALILEHRDGAVNALVLQWLASLLPLPNQPVLLGTVEAMKTVVSLGLGIRISPQFCRLGEGEKAGPVMNARRALAQSSGI